MVVLATIAGRSWKETPAMRNGFAPVVTGSLSLRLVLQVSCALYANHMGFQRRYDVRTLLKGER